jgi:hypothetical protein
VVDEEVPREESKSYADGSSIPAKLGSLVREADFQVLFLLRFLGWKSWRTSTLSRQGLSFGGPVVAVCAASARTRPAAPHNFYHAG